MSRLESLSELSVDERDNLADKFSLARREDRHSVITIKEGAQHGYQTDRDLSGYYETINKYYIEKFVEHVISFSDNPSLLDLGTGKGFAAKELRQKYNSDSLRVVGTSMTLSKELEENLGNGNYHITSAESLRRVGKVDGILAVHSLNYVDPKLFVPRVNELLNDGGIILANFTLPRSMWPRKDNAWSKKDDESLADLLKKTYPNGSPMKEYNSDYFGFEKGFKELGYSTDVHVGSDQVLFVASKPGIDIVDPVEDFIYRVD